MKRLVFIFLFLLSGFLGFACTTFLINHNGQLVFGRNYDWITGSGMICSNLRGLAKTSAHVDDGKPISWVSKYGSLTFNQYGKEFPTGGMNEKGLVVELMWLDGTRYPGPDQRSAIGVLQWIQYQLDNCASVAEVIATDKILRITNSETPLHYLIADASGNVAAIEFLDGKMVAHQGEALPFPVLTNSTYEQSKKQASPEVAANMGTFQDNSIARFAKACSMVKDFAQNKVSIPATDHAFKILDRVAQGSHTKWSIVYDLKNKTVRFKTNGFTGIKTTSFAAFDFDCNATVKAYDLNQNKEGNISAAFKTFTPEMNREILQKSITESSSQVPISDQSRERILSYSSTIICNKVANN